jgi:hypothetical protein
MWLSGFLERGTTSLQTRVINRQQVVSQRKALGFGSSDGSLRLSVREEEPVYGLYPVRAHPRRDISPIARNFNPRNTARIPVVKIFARF